VLSLPLLQLAPWTRRAARMRLLQRRALRPCGERLVGLRVVPRLVVVVLRERQVAVLTEQLMSGHAVLPAQVLRLELHAPRGHRPKWIALQHLEVVLLCEP